MSKPPKSAQDRVGLPIDDGRGLGERWPWRIVEDYSAPAVGKRRPLLLYILVILGGMLVLGTVGLGPTILYILLLPLALRLSKSGHREVTIPPSPAWKIRNLFAADHRANRCLDEVDPGFAREMGHGSADPDLDILRAAEGVIQEDPNAINSELGRQRAPKGSPPWDFPTTGPILPDEDDSLPF